MNTYKITFLPSGRTADVKEGTTLLEAQICAGLIPDAPCGGLGKCGKCLVDVLSGSRIGITKACSLHIDGPMTIDTSIQPTGHQLLEHGFSRNLRLHPHLQIHPIHLEKSALLDDRTDWQKLKNALEPSMGEGVEALLPNLPLLSSLYSFCRENADGYAIVSPPYLLDIVHEHPHCYLAAIDIGTTSIVGYLLDLDTGDELAAAGILNPQAQFGADVILRANYALEHTTVPLKSAVANAILDVLEQLCRIADINKEQIYQISIAGNTCMNHLFLGLSPASLVHAPYHPVISQALILDAKAYGISIHPNGQLYILPNIAGFVGADTVGCLLATDFDNRHKLTLLIDIGTNGELVLGDSRRMVCCSTAAGPAFEGAKITCGMRGAAGAIDHLYFHGEKLVYSTILHQAPKGICGSGLLDLIAALLTHGFVDASGRFLKEDALTSPAALANRWRITKLHGQTAFLIADEKESAEGTPIYLTQKDITEVQLAKAAIASGIRLLAQSLQVSLTDIEQVLIAGAFGTYMNPSSACRIGLIPSTLSHRITPIGNAAGEGAKLVLLCKEEWEHAKHLAVKTEFLELASSENFQDCFVDELEFPV